MLALGQTLDDVGAAFPGFAVRRLDGGQWATKRALLSALARALEFPVHFGQNWDALEDCLTDLEWLPVAGYLLMIAEADRLLAGYEEDYRIFVAILERAGAEWATPRSGVVARPPRSFHTLLTVPAPRAGARRDWGVPVRHGAECLTVRRPIVGAGTSTEAEAGSLSLPAQSQGHEKSEEKP